MIHSTEATVPSHESGRILRDRALASAVGVVAIGLGASCTTLKTEGPGGAALKPASASTSERSTPKAKNVASKDDPRTPSADVTSEDDASAGPSTTKVQPREPDHVSPVRDLGM